MNFIKLTFTEARKSPFIWVNPAHIVDLCVLIVGEGTGLTTCAGENNTIHVKETPEEIFALIEQMKRDDIRDSQQRLEEVVYRRPGPAIVDTASTYALHEYSKTDYPPGGLPDDKQ